MHATHATPCPSRQSGQPSHRRRLVVARSRISKAKRTGKLRRDLEANTSFNPSDAGGMVELMDDLVVDNVMPTLDSMVDSLKALTDRQKQLQDGLKVGPQGWSEGHQEGEIVLLKMFFVRTSCR